MGRVVSCQLFCLIHSRFHRASSVQPPSLILAFVFGPVRQLSELQQTCPSSHQGLFGAAALIATTYGTTLLSVAIIVIDVLGPPVKLGRNFETGLEAAVVADLLEVLAFRDD